LWTGDSDGSSRADQMARLQELALAISSVPYHRA
jgi:hypothetical protein